MTPLCAGHYAKTVTLNEPTGHLQKMAKINNKKHQQGVLPNVTKFPCLCLGAHNSADVEQRCAKVIMGTSTLEADHDNKVSVQSLKNCGINLRLCGTELTTCPKHNNQTDRDTNLCPLQTLFARAMKNSLNHRWGRKEDIQTDKCIRKCQL